MRIASRLNIYRKLRARLDLTVSWFAKSSARRYFNALVPGLLTLIITLFTDLRIVSSRVEEIFLWTPFEAILWIGLLIAGVLWTVYREISSVRKRLAEVSKAEEYRRAIAAIGMAASWDLDLDRLYRRVSQDLRSILEFERFTVTRALPTGRMQIEFVSGNELEGHAAGSILPESPEEPDGLFAEYRPNYRSRLTAAIPACNGTLTIRTRGEEQYSSAHLDLLRQAVAQISPGIANAMMFQSSERRLRERTVLAEIGRAATSASDAGTIIKAVDESLSKIITYDHMGLILVDEEKNRGPNGVVTYWSHAGLSGWNQGDRIPFDFDSATRGVVVTGHGSEFWFTPEPEAPPDGTVRTWLQAPLFVQEELIGMLVLSSVAEDELGPDTSSLILNVSLQIAPAIQTANLTATLKRRADERRTVAAIGLAANSDLNLSTIYKSVADELSKVLEFERLAITHLRPDDKYEIAYATGIEVDGCRVGDLVEISNINKPSLDSASQDWLEASPEMKPLVEKSGLKSRATAPLGSATQVIGRLHMASLKENAYDSQDVDLLERIAIQITPAIRNAQMIAAERELRETLDRQNQELYEANHARKQFLSSVSHELKTPLTIISGFIDLLASPGDVQSQEERQETFTIIRRNADHLNVLINDILDISRLDAGTFKINPLPMSMNSLISDLEASFQSLLRTKTQTLAVEIPEDEVWIRADESRISQVITNLVSNASKYSPDGTVITLGCEIDGDRAHVTVADQGVGLTEEEQKGLFNAFFRADNETTRKVSGTGLGLVIAKSITELHGGEIRLESQLGEGTTIEFWLPNLTTKETAEIEVPKQEEFSGSRLWPDGMPPDLELGAD